MFLLFLLKQFKNTKYLIIIVFILTLICPFDYTVSPFLFQKIHIRWNLSIQQILEGWLFSFLNNNVPIANHKENTQQGIVLPTHYSVVRAFRA